MTDGYSIENYYLSEACVGAILEVEFKMSKAVCLDEYQRCMNLFRQEHRIFLKLHCSLMLGIAVFIKVKIGIEMKCLLILDSPRIG